MSFLSGVQTATDFLSSVFARLWDVVISWPFVACAVMMPFVFWLLCRIVGMVRNASRFDVETWGDYGLAGVVKRHKERQESRQKEVFANRILGDIENLDVQFVDIDGQRFYRRHRSRKYKVRLGDRSSQYYSASGDYIPVYDGNRQSRKKD